MADDQQKRCFVVMGFGTKTDFATGRKLDLNKSYRLLIKPVVEAKGLACVRADEIVYTGSIDVQMYLELLNADVVIADISTANPNALYELGVRHALRPRTTIVISENKMPYPFDLNHIKITSYAHLGDAIDYEEVERFRKVLTETLDDVLRVNDPDSPVYTFLQLDPPSLKEQIAHAVEEKKKEIEAADKSYINPKTLAVITEDAEEALAKNDFITAKALFNSALLIGKTEDDQNKMGVNRYLVHRLALATYKAKQPDEVAALYDALKLLLDIDLSHTNDTETVALAGAIEKRLYENKQGEEHLSAGILYYQRGYYLLNNRYHGINLAFMLDYRAQSALCTTKDERIADLVNAKRIRKEVLLMCDNDWEQIKSRQESTAMKDGLQRNDDYSVSQNKADKEQMFWILINRAEANFGLGEMDAYQKAVDDAEKMEHDEWMMDSLQEQIEKLKKMIQKQQLVDEEH
jgi:hypothetical protein